MSVPDDYVLMANGLFSILNGCATGGCRAMSGNSSVKDKVVRIMRSSAEYNEGNSWICYPQSGQVNGNNNNNNKYNANVVRPVVELERKRVNGWMAAYADCLSNKMTSCQCTLYRLDDTDLLVLMQECEERRYVPSKSICFCVTIPKVREIFAAAFRDRIVQHWICLRIEPLLEQRFIEQGDVSWNCRKNHGTQRAALALQRDIIEVSCGYTRKAYVGRFDIVSFFMSIDIRILERLVVDFVREKYRGDDKDLLVYLLVVTMRHRPQDNCERRGDPRLWKLLSKGKSLFGAERFRGMPIGNITSQLLANFYMSFFDEYMVGLCKKIGARYERFVDDFAVVCPRKEDVLMLRDKAGVFLKEQLNLEMHRDKQYIQDVTKGVYFVGNVIKMERMYIANRTLGGMCQKLRELQGYLGHIHGKDFWLANAYELEHYQASINSYLGFMRGKQSYGMCRKAFAEHCPLFFDYFYIGGHFEVVKVKREYSIKYQLLRIECYD